MATMEVLNLSISHTGAVDKVGDGEKELGDENRFPYSASTMKIGRSGWDFPRILINLEE